MQWADVVADSSLKDLPYKIELNEHGQILMTPHRPLHSELQGVLLEELNHRIQGGRAVPEYAIRTTAGVRVADVVWRSAARWGEIQAAGTASAPVAPELCIEVRSHGNTDAEMTEKRALYFDAGALEVWTCDENGQLRFFDPGNELAQSKLVPSFPIRIEV
ncbi:Uma2 family endonuclease [Candidatus Thiosymbion oneisti]|uniref:Uma2 family endonuclease n=1 Tax=Candidatus Thiosymbion oneisti TaxID=589554 RepID=UPI000B7D63E8|nr:Uma2 family endonuclease [Candidatus Thiosymbion oneisti]